MHLQEYDFITGAALGPLTALDFGNVIQGQHCGRPVVLRALTDGDSSVSGLNLSLINRGAWTTAQYGYYVNPTFVPSVEAGSSQLAAHHFDSTTQTVSIGWDGTQSNYVWLDLQTSLDQTGINSATLRLSFDHS